MKIKNTGNRYIYNLLAEEEIPSIFSVEGPTKRSFTLKGGQTEELYSYYLNINTFNTSQTYPLRTKVFFDFEDQSYTLENSKNIYVKAPDPLQLEETIDVEDIAYIHEPLHIDFSFKNNNTRPIRNFTLYIPLSTDYDIEKKDLYYPSIYPEQYLNFSLTLLPKKNISEITGISYTFNSEDGISTEKNLSLDINLKNARVSSPSVSYDIEIIKGVMGDVKAKIKINKTYDENFRTRINYFNPKPESYDISEKGITEIEYYVDKKYYQNEIKKGYLDYDYLGKTYEIYPSSYTKNEIIPPPKTTNLSNSSNIVETYSQEKTLEKKDGGTFLGLIIIGFFLIFIFISIPILIYIKKYMYEIHLKINEKEYDNSVEKPAEEFHVVKNETDIKSSDFEKKKAKNNSSKTPTSDSKEESISEKHLEPTNIISFDEYEAFREKIEKHHNIKK